MARMHIHISVDDLEKSTDFYSKLFGKKPTKQKEDYAKWMLNDPRVNFAISARGAKTGLDHLGMQAEEEDEMDGLRERLERADISTFNDGETTCCYAKSDKTWVQDPAGIAWEVYRNMKDVEYFNDTAMGENTCSDTARRSGNECCE